MGSTTTISDIARLAGVGTATVDRVLNRRPGVNAQALRRVMQAVAELGAPPQPGRLRHGENIRVACVLPAEESPFFNPIERRIAQSAGDCRHQHITEVTHRIEVGDPAQSAAALAGLGDCQGLGIHDEPGRRRVRLTSADELRPN
jgi:LacI family transcriptional regulator